MNKNPSAVSAAKKMHCESSIVRIGQFDLYVPNGHIYTHEGLPREYDYFPLSLMMYSIKKLLDIHFIDIGANVGDTLAHVKTISPDIEVTCIEPSDYFFSFLEENSKKFTKVNLLNKFVSPKNLRSRINFHSGNSTGFTEVVGENCTQTIIDAKKFVDLEDLLKYGRPNIVKTDTDGFDLHILADLVSILDGGKYNVPLIYFEGPAEQDFTNLQFDKWFPLIESLIKMSYKLIFIQNNGLPYVNAGLSIETAKSAMYSLHMGFLAKRPPFHYFDILAYKPEVENPYLLIEKPWPQTWCRP